MKGLKTISSLPSDDWTILQFRVVLDLTLLQQVSASGSQSVKLDNSQGTNGSIDELISNTIDLIQ